MADENENENPFAEPIRSIFSRICGIGWRMPFIPQLIQLIVQSLVLFVLCVLYSTIGIVYHCYSIFVRLLEETRDEVFEEDLDLVGKSAWALTAGLYLLLAAPCWIIVFPFMLLGWLWRKLSWFGIILYLIILLSVVYLIKMDVEPLRESVAWIKNHFVSGQ